VDRARQHDAMREIMADRNDPCSRGAIWLKALGVS
jgi:hypothetical protein